MIHSCAPNTYPMCVTPIRSIPRLAAMVGEQCCLLFLLQLRLLLQCHLPNKSYGLGLCRLLTMVGARARARQPSPALGAQHTCSVAQCSAGEGGLQFHTCPPPRHSARG